MALPEPTTRVSPFDVILSQTENEDRANLEALAAGTGLDDNAVTSDKIDFSTLPISINSSSGTTVTATSYTNIGLDTTATIRDSGKALVIISTYKMGNATAAAETWLSYSVSGASSITSSDSRSIMIQSASANLPQIGGSFTGVITGLTPGSNTFNVQGKVSTGNGFFSTVTITVIPL